MYVAMPQLTVVAKTKFIQIIVYAARRVVFLLFFIFGTKASQTFIFCVYSAYSLDHCLTLYVSRKTRSK